MEASNDDKKIGHDRKSIESIPPLYKRVLGQRSLIPLVFATGLLAFFVQGKINTKPSNDKSAQIRRGIRDKALGQFSPQEQAERVLEIEGFSFSFSSDFSKEEYEEISRIIKISTPAILYYIPKVKNVGKSISVLKSNTISSASYQEGTLHINPKSTDAVKVHEMVHLIRGEYDTWYALLEEGTAVAVAEIVCESLDLEKWSKSDSVQVNENFSRRMSVSEKTQYTDNKTTHLTRYYFAHKVWREYEDNQPGFIWQLHEKYFEFLKTNDESALDQSALIKILKSINAPLTEDMMSRHPIMSFESKMGTERIVYITYNRSKKLNSEYVNIQLVERNKPDGRENVGRLLPLEYTVIDLDRNESSKTHKATTNLYGNFCLSLRNSENGKWKMLDGLKESKNFRIIIKTDTGTEVFDFQTQ
jgi:hypothetical protein